MFNGSRRNGKPRLANDVIISGGLLIASYPPSTFANHTSATASQFSNHRFALFYIQEKQTIRHEATTSDSLDWPLRRHGGRPRHAESRDCQLSQRDTRFRRQSSNRCDQRGSKSRNEIDLMRSGRIDHGNRVALSRMNTVSTSHDQSSLDSH